MEQQQNQQKLNQSFMEICIRSWNEQKAYYYAIFASICYVVMYALTKKLLQANFQTFQIVYFRCLISASFNLTYLKCNKSIKYFSENSNSINLLLTRSLLCVLNMIFNFLSFKLMNLSDSLVLLNTYPIFSTLFGAILINESISKFIIPCIFFNFLGVFLIARPVAVF